MSFRPSQILSTAVVAALISSAAVAQPAMTGPTPAVTIGVKFGLNYSTLDVEDDGLPLKHVLDGTGGVFIGRSLSNNVGVQLEALFGQRGAEDDDDPADGRFRLRYLDLPVTARVGTTAARGLGFHVFTGPQLSIKLKAEEINYGLDSSRDAGDDIKGWDFGWTVGAGVEAQRVSLDARYTHGLLDINNAGGSWVKSRMFTVLLGVRLR